MQFQFNSDHPSVDTTTGEHLNSSVMDARDPLDFPPAQPIPCARITTRIFHPLRNQVATVQNVLVRTIAIQPPTAPGVADDDQVSWSSSSSDTSRDDDMSDASDHAHPAQQQQQPADAAASASGANDCAYWVQRTVREAIYGRVMFGVVLRRRHHFTTAANDNAEWQVTDQHVAIKEMSWQHIRRERDRLAEDPIKEVSSMQFLQQWHTALKSRSGSSSPSAPLDSVQESFLAIMETNIMMPLDLLSDDRNLYSIMPYCDGGELFERLDMNERFSEGEARYWMDQILNGLETLQSAGICHRDMSLENLLVHSNGALIIDMGMCLRIPLVEEDPLDQLQHPYSLSASMQAMSMNGTVVPGTTTTSATASTSLVSARFRRRHLMRPQGTCGKWLYMSPEIYKNREPFDGYAVDMWACGVILFLMLTGFPPWERACATDERFPYMSAGYLVQMLTEWQIPISGDAMDLLQRMLFLDPKDRLSLDQVRAHPWMVNGPRQPPVN